MRVIIYVEAQLQGRLRPADCLVIPSMFRLDLPGELWCCLIYSVKFCERAMIVMSLHEHKRYLVYLTITSNLFSPPKKVLDYDPRPSSGEEKGPSDSLVTHELGS